ncbi:MAG: hypothetical protein IPJ86_08070 [Bacteroidetes bacterium]|nr:hypothetical protein [Bacteroidota bacterium]
MSLSIIFKDSLLIGYSLGSYLQSNDGVCGVLKKFVNIYGSPNVFSNKFIRGNLIDSDEYLRFKNERFAKSYYESYNDAINSFNCDYHELSSVDSFLDQSQGNNFQVWLSPDDRETNDFGFFQGWSVNRQYAANDENGYKVNLRFYDYFEVAYSWNKKRFLIISLKRNKRLRPPGDQFNRSAYSRLYFESDFGIEITFLKILMFTITIR